jgi:hypothetical protein
MLKRIDKKTMIYLGGLVLFIILVFVVVIVFANGSRSSNYEKIEKIMEEAAIKYASNNNSILPTKEGNQITIMDVELSSLEYMKPLSKLLKKEPCTGKVVIEKTEDSYLYIPYLTCGTSYNSLKLYEKVLEDNKVVQNGDGLYKINNEYVFRGEDPNNYIEFGSTIYRIVKIDVDNNIQIIKGKKDSKERTVKFDDRYNSEIGYSYGKNIFSQSRMKEHLEERLDDLDTSLKTLLVAKDWCVGLRSKGSVALNNSQECLTLNQNSKIGLLTTYDFMIVSNDSECSIITNRTCLNYNYLVKSYSWWLSTPGDKDSSRVYMVTSGIVSQSNASKKAYIRESYYLNDVVRYASGDGTETNPYVFK